LKTRSIDRPPERVFRPSTHNGAVRAYCARVDHDDRVRVHEPPYRAPLRGEGADITATGANVPVGVDCCRAASTSLIVAAAANAADDRTKNARRLMNMAPAICR
jgi:hypothetical protein